MPKYLVEVLKTQRREVEVEADSLAEAYDKATLKGEDDTTKQEFWSWEPLFDSLEVDLLRQTSD